MIPARTLTAVTGALFAVAVQATDISGAGSTFAAPIYASWANAYQKSGGGKVSYRSVGSSDGIRQILAKTVDFAGSDAPLKDEDLAKDGLIQFPTVVGGVVPVVNLPDVGPGDLTLSGPVLGDIYLGKVTNWNDPIIAALNPHVKLPDLAIAVIRRSDGSGTTFIWTHYLSQVNPEWKRRIGEGTNVRWPHGAGARGNEGVALFVQRLPGAIGYVAWDFTKQNHMAYTSMTNAAGNALRPGPDAFKAAAAGADWSRSFHQILTNEPGKDAWPVVGATFVLLHTTPDKPGHAEETLKFFDWAFRHGDRAAEALDYIPLPDPVVSEIRSQWRAKVKDAQGKPIVE
ncbi:phosphate transport system substrate-binding protein [Paraburkholderia sp. GAS448]|uniref:phosphate ABC transporter substrate-binding protein PstS n=1 Tax=Paraburkholderia sp. GAS448 TaxID=3035136 RepID=UPI003D1C8A8A